MTAKPSYEELERRIHELEKIESEYKSSQETLQENERLFKMFEELNEINRISNFVGSTLDLEEVLRRILENVIESVNSSVGMIFLTNPVKGNITWGASLGLSEQFVNDFKETPIRIGEGLTGTIAQTGKPIFIQENSSNDPRIVRPVVVKENLNSFLGVPIFVADKVVGVMNILTRPPVKLEERDKHFCSAVGSQVGLAIINAKKYSELKKIEKVLKESEALFRGMFKDHSAVMLLIDPDTGQIIKANQAAVQYYGYPLEKMLQMKIQQLNVLSPAEITEQMRCALNKQANIFEFQHLLSDGQIRDVEVHSSPITIQHQTLLFSIIRDITERKQAEATLRESEERIRTIGDNLQAAQLYQFRVAPDGGTKFTYVSSKVEELHECKPEDVLKDASLLFKRVHPADVDEWQKRTHKSLKELITYDHTVRIVRKSGEIRWHRMISKPRKLDDGSVLFDGVELDVTEHKQAEEALRESLMRYDELVANVPVGVYVFWIRATGNLEFEYVSDRWCEIHQVKREDVLSDATRVNNLVHPDDRDDFLVRNQESFLKRIPFAWEGRFLIGGGKLRWLRIESTPIVFDNGDIRWLGVTWDITDRKQAEEGLRESNLRYQILVETTTDWVWSINLEGHHIFTNPAVESILGYTSQEIIGTSSYPLIAPEDESMVHTLLSESVQLHSGWRSVPIRWLHKDGSIKYMESSAQPVFDTNGNLTGFSGIDRDITERKRAETYREMEREILQILNEPGDLRESIQRALAALKTQTGVDAAGLRLQEGEDFPYFAQDGFSKEFLRTENTLLERSKDGGVCRDKDGNVRLECTCGLVISGKTDPSNPLFTQGGSCWTNDSVPLLDLPSDQDPRLHPRNNCIHQGYASVALIPVRIQGQMYSRETCVRHGFSSIAQVPVRTSDRIVGLIQLNDKRKGRFTLETIEILESIAAHVGSALIRKQAEESLEKSLSLIDATMSSLEEGLLVVNMEGKVIRHNRAFLDLWEIPPVLESSNDAMLLEHVASRLADPEAFLSKVRQLYDEPEESSFDELAFADGRVFERFSQPLWQGRQITGRIWCFRNITDRKRTEKQSEELQAQLNQAQKMESVGRLAGGVAHDFNNMLGVILGHTELSLLKAEEDNDLISDLEEIQTAAKRSADITKQLLAFARKQNISPRKLDLNDTVESMLNMLRRLIGEDIDLVWQPAAHIWPVKMDPSQIDQILANLCVNARDAIDGVGKLTIETGRKSFDEEYCKEHVGFIPGDFVLLAVSDNGCGMDKDTLKNIFEPFFTTKEVDKGTGLGLATIYGIVKQNNGFINVYSEPGQGSTFRIYLPRLVADEDIDKAVAEKKAAVGGSETILLVEDEPTILRMTRMMLERKGYSVLTAATPGEAIEKATNHSGSIDLLMTDVVMPEMNGRDLSGQITDLYPDIKLLFMSGYTADVIAHQGILDKGVAFIQKPFSMADMTEKVRDVLDSASDKS